MSADEVRYFLEVYQSKSLSQAASALGISSQGLGKSIRRMESRLGVRLFDRSPQGVTPTPVAHQIHDNVQEIARNEERIREIARRAQAEGQSASQAQGGQPS